VCHELALEVRVGVVLSVVVPVPIGRRMRGEALQPVVEVLDEPRLVVVDVDGRGDVHGVHEDEPLADPGPADEVLDVRGDVHVIPPIRRLEGQVVGGVPHAQERSAPSGEAARRSAAFLAWRATVCAAIRTAAVRMAAPRNGSPLHCRVASRPAAWRHEFPPHDLPPERTQDDAGKDLDDPLRGL
jgi:hypothetical protein